MNVCAGAFISSWTNNFHLVDDKWHIKGGSEPYLVLRLCFTWYLVENILILHQTYKSLDFQQWSIKLIKSGSVSKDLKKKFLFKIKSCALKKHNNNNKKASVSTKIWSSTTVFNFDKCKECFLSSKSAYYYDFWRSCETEAWSNDAENTALITGINYFLKYIKTKKVPRSRLKQRGDGAFEVAGPDLWNSLPQLLRSTPTFLFSIINLV